MPEIELSLLLILSWKPVCLFKNLQFFARHVDIRYLGVSASLTVLLMRFLLVQRTSRFPFISFSI